SVGRSRREDRPRRRGLRPAASLHAARGIRPRARVGRPRSRARSAGASRRSAPGPFARVSAMRLSRDILIGETAIGARVEALARAIAADTAEGTELSVIGLMDGAFMFAADLVRRLPMPVRLALVPFKSIDRGGNPAEITLPEGFPLEGADVLVVEDILDSGRTLLALKSHIL